MTYRSSLQFSGMYLYCEFYDGPQGPEMRALHLVRILKYTGGFWTARICGLAIVLLEQQMHQKYLSTISYYILQLYFKHFSSAEPDDGY